MAHAPPLHVRLSEETPAIASPPAPARALASLSLATLLAALGTSIANVALPTLAHAFAAPFQKVQWVVLAYLLAITTLIVGAGRLGDVVGRRRSLLAGVLVFTLASALCGIAPTLGALIAARAAQGLGAALMMTLALGIVSEVVPKNRTGSAMGLLGTMSAIGTALGPSLGGLLITSLGWRAVFLAPVPVGLATWFLARRHLPPDQPRSAHQRAALDPTGTVLLALILASYALALTLGRGRFGPVNAALMLTALAGGAALVAVERSVASPLIDVALFRRHRLRNGLAATALVSAVLMATLVVGPFHLSRALALDTAQVGLVMMMGPFVAALAGVPAGRLVDHWGPCRAAILGLAGAATGALVLAMTPTTWGLAGYVVPIVPLTAGYALFQAANNTTIMAEAADQRGTISGLLNLARNLGLITGASALGAVFIHATGTSEIAVATPAAVAVGTRVTFALGAVLILIALALNRRRVFEP